jgi:hypothetical protein
MDRTATRTRFRPCLDQLDKKTLLSAAPITHLASGLDRFVATPQAQLKLYTVTIVNDTGRKIEIGKLKAEVDDAGKRSSKSNPVVLPNKTGKWRFEFDVKNFAAQLKLFLDSREVTTPRFSVSGKTPDFGGEEYFLK